MAAHKLTLEFVAANVSFTVEVTAAAKVALAATVEPCRDGGAAVEAGGYVRVGKFA